MQKRKPGRPHKGWKDAARQRMRGCACAVCSTPVLGNITDALLFEYLDKLPRAQWCNADAMLYANFAIERERSIRIAKTWLKQKILLAA